MNTGNRILILASLCVLALIRCTDAAQQTINVGTTPSDGTGDSLRSAFTKTNANFTELYSLSTAINAGNITAGTLPIARIADASLTNAKLQNSSITINGSAVSLGQSVTLATTLSSLTDVTLTAAAANDFLVKSAGNWVNLAPAAARTALGLGTLATQNGTISDYAPKANPTFTGTINGASLSLSGGISVTGGVATGSGDLQTTVGNIMTGSGYFYGNGSNITALNASAITSGTLAAARIADASLPVAKISGLATSATTDTTSASNITTGTLPLARIADGSVTLAKLGSLTLQDETLAYYKAVLAAGGSIDAMTLFALDSVVVAGKRDGWWSLVIEAYPFCGDGLAAALVKLKITAGNATSLTNTNFVSSDYSQGGGFGPKTTNANKGLGTGVVYSALGYSLTDAGFVTAVCDENVTAVTGRAIGDKITGNSGDCRLYFQHWNASMIVGSSVQQGYQSLNPTARVISYMCSASTHHATADGVQLTQWTQATSGTMNGEMTLFETIYSGATRRATGKLGMTMLTRYMTPAQARACTAAVSAFERQIRDVYNRESPGMIFWGDSITATQGATATNDGFAPIVARRLGLRPVNHGNPSAWFTADTGVVGAATQSADILNQPERTIVMMFGSNDVQYSVTDTTYNSTLNTICAAAQSARRRLVLCTPSYTSTGANQSTLRLYASRLATAAVTYGFPFADTNIAGADNPQQTDAVHPNTAGHLQMADVITAAMRGVQVRKPTIDLANLAAGATTSGTVTMLTARVGQDCSVTPPSTFDAGMIIAAKITANDTVTYTVTNTTGGAIDEESGIYVFTVRTAP